MKKLKKHILAPYLRILFVSTFRDEYQSTNHVTWVETTNLETSNTSWCKLLFLCKMLCSFVFCCRVFDNQITLWISGILNVLQIKINIWIQEILLTCGWMWQFEYTKLSLWIYIQIGIRSNKSETYYITYINMHFFLFCS